MINHTKTLCTPAIMLFFHSHKHVIQTSILSQILLHTKFQDLTPNSTMVVPEFAGSRAGIVTDKAFKDRLAVMWL
jgi:hypothetical protein